MNIRVILSLAMLLGLSVSAVGCAASSQTTLNQTVQSGTLGISAGSTASMSAVATSNIAQVSSGSLGAVNVTDNRGLGAGWSATVTASNFTYVNTATKVSGNNTNVVAGGTYTGAASGTYTVTITTGGTVGTAQFAVSGMETVASTTTGATSAVGTKGVTANFSPAVYVTGDSWTIRADSIAATNLTVTPSAVTTNSGSAAGVSAGSAHTFTSTNDPTTIMSANFLTGLGSYTNTPALSLVVPANSYANTYTATIIETVN